MKSRNDFTTVEDYQEYLKHYYAGLAMQALVDKAYTSAIFKNTAQISISFAKHLVHELNIE